MLPSSSAFANTVSEEVAADVVQNQLADVAVLILLPVKNIGRLQAYASQTAAMQFNRCNLNRVGLGLVNIQNFHISSQLPVANSVGLSVHRALKLPRAEEPKPLTVLVPLFVRTLTSAPTL